MLRGWNSKSQWMRWPAICLLARKLNSPGINLLWVRVPLLRICASQFPVFFLQTSRYICSPRETYALNSTRLIDWYFGKVRQRSNAYVYVRHSIRQSIRKERGAWVLFFCEESTDVYIIVPRRRSFKMRTRRGTCTRREGDLACVFLPNSHGPSFFFYVYFVLSTKGI